MSEREKIVLLDDPYNDPSEGEHLEFRLRYEGPLRATQNDPLPGSSQTTKHHQLKHDIRRVFHCQLRDQWRRDPTLHENQSSAGTPKPYHINTLAEANQIAPWKFVPLVTEELELICGIDLLILRKDHRKGRLFGRTGDIDNRVKTILDALRMPNAHDGYHSLIVQDGEDPFFCLLEDDKLVTNLSVESGDLLNAPNDSDLAYAVVSVKVTIRPEKLMFNNIGL